MANRKQDLFNYLEKELRHAIDEGITLAGAVARHPFSRELSERLDDLVARISDLQEDLGNVWKVSPTDVRRIQEQLLKRGIDKTYKEVQLMVEKKEVPAHIRGTV